MVTKQQQLKWLAKHFESLPFGSDSILMSDEVLGYIGYEHKITNQELKQERDKMSSKPEVDNSWYERGEFPPAGCECDIRHSCWNSEKYEKVTVAAITNEYLIVKYATFEQHYMLKDISFRPIRTERDVLLSVIVEEMNRYDTDGKLADAILAAGFSLRDK